MTFRVLFLALAASFVAIAGNVSAELIYDFHFDKTVYSVEAGSTFKADIFFRETATAGEKLRFFTSPLGFTSFGPLQLNYGPALSVASATDVTVDPAFSDGSFFLIDNPNSRIEGLSGVVISGIKGPDTSSYQVKVASVEFTAVGNGGDNLTISLEDATGLGTAFFDNEFAQVSSNIGFSSAQVSLIATVPEPATVFLLGPAIAGYAFFQRRKRRREFRSNSC